MLDACRNELANTSWYEFDVFDSEGQRVEELSNEYDLLGGPVQHDDALVVVLRDALIQSKQ